MNEKPKWIRYEQYAAEMGRALDRLWAADEREREMWQAFLNMLIGAHLA